MVFEASFKTQLYHVSGVVMASAFITRVRVSLWASSTSCIFLQLGWSAHPVHIGVIAGRSAT